MPLNIVFQAFDHNHRKSRILAMSKPVYSAIKSYSYDENTIIYTPDRKIARLIALDIITYTIGEDQPYKFTQNAEILDIDFKSKILAHTIKYGIGLIFEGMAESDKAYVQDLYKDNILRILVISSSLC